MGKFADQIDKFARKHEARLRAIARTAVQETISQAQRTEGEGGRMRVKTGFLRASIQAAVNGIPSGPVAPHKNAKDGEFVGGQVAGKPLAVALLQWDVIRDEKLFVGWTANYARPREYKDGFLRGAVERWDKNVAKAVKEVEARFG